RGVELHIAGRGRLENKTSTGFLAIGIEAMFAEFYRKQCSEKITGALATLKAEGKQWSRIAPYGFEDRDGRGVAHRAEQAVIRQARVLRSRGESLRAISDQPAARGIMARNKRPFAAQTLAQVLGTAGAQATGGEVGSAV